MKHPTDTELLRALVRGESGKRIAEIRAALSNPPEPVALQDQLQRLMRQGQVIRTIDGRWKLSRDGEALARLNERPSAKENLLPDGLPAAEDHGPPGRLPNAGFVTDPSQAPVVDAGADVRQIVEAGPGFGKTAVLCARVAKLLSDGIEPANILVLSFTRTAVRELRERVKGLAAGPGASSQVNIRTLDSWAYRVYALYNTTASASYDASIEFALGALRTPSDELQNYVEGFEHVFVDEAQDLIGARAQLVLRLLRLLRATAGYTVFFDPAQAIYDWAEHDEKRGAGDPSFADLLADLPEKPVRRSLAVLHRTRDHGLRRLLLGARQLVLGKHVEKPGAHLLRVLDGRTGGTTCNLETLVDRAGTIGNDALILSRWRASALEISGRLAWKEVPHRLRFGDLPMTVAPWIAVLLYEGFTEAKKPALSRTVLERAWSRIDNPCFTDGWSFERAWQMIRRMGRHSSTSAIDLAAVATAVAERKIPDEVMLKELGPAGPVVGTIHGSKGREADRVLFLLPDGLPADCEDDATKDRDEARVLYVAVTRARERLDVLRQQRFYCGHLDGGRVWSSEAKNAIRVEIGREDDLDVVRSIIAGGLQQQDWLRKHDGRIRSIKGRLNPGRNWSWDLHDENAPGGSLIVGVLSQECSKEIRLAAGKGKTLGYTTSELHHLNLLDVRTCAVSPDSIFLDQIPQPWRTLRLWLAPVVVGLGRTFRQIKRTS